MFLPETDLWLWVNFFFFLIWIFHCCDYLRTCLFMQSDALLQVDIYEWFGKVCISVLWLWLCRHGSVHVFLSTTATITSSLYQKNLKNPFSFRFMVHFTWYISHSSYLRSSQTRKKILQTLNLECYSIISLFTFKGLKLIIICGFYNSDQCFHESKPINISIVISVKLKWNTVVTNVEIFKLLQGKKLHRRSVPCQASRLLSWLHFGNILTLLALANPKTIRLGFRVGWDEFE